MVFKCEGDVATVMVRAAKFDAKPPRTQRIAKKKAEKNYPQKGTESAKQQDTKNTMALRDTKGHKTKLQLWLAD